MKTLSRIEVILGAILLLIFLIWSFDKCQGTKAEHQPQQPPQQEEPVNDPTPTEPQQPTQPTTQQTTPPPSQPTTTTVVQNVSTLYVSVDSLKLRVNPYLNSNILDRLPKNSQVSFLGERTETTQQIKLNGKDYDEPWVKVQAPSGKVGWVYGGGVTFYKPN